MNVNVLSVAGEIWMFFLYVFLFEFEALILGNDAKIALHNKNVEIVKECAANQQKKWLHSTYTLERICRI